MYKQSWEVTFCQGIDEAVSLEEYLESLLAHWYRPTLVKAPLVPKDLAASQIRKFLEGLERVNRVEEIRIPRNGSGALNLFCYNPVATMEAVSTVQYFPDIWQKVLPSLDILTFIPSAQDEAFIEEVVFQYTAPSLSSVARFIKHKFKQRSLSHPMQLWRKNLANTLPPAAEVIFLCEKFKLANSDYLRRGEYSKIRQLYQNREAV
ncbi:MAG: hypothetical protein IEMM0001_2246 [bacterium]|nr:MAG: hypothetical protein IEMM0001_2246 [bacterium]